jgi:N-acetylglucosamine kinase-like BadF-type ATPase
METYFLGVDLGGTQMRMAAVTPEGSLHGRAWAHRCAASLAFE